MVMRLPLPEADSVQLVAQVVAERAGGQNAAYFAGIAHEWQQRVQAYIAAGGNPQTLTQWTAIEPRKNSFLNLYLSPTAGSAQGQMLQTLRSHGMTVCPACGELGRPNTLDHYLPKAIYPHFCITPANLFPMCDACQTAKGNKVGDAQSARFFVHPYFDVFVAEQVIRLVIEVPYHAPNFRLEVSNSLTADQQTLVRTHVRELEIVRRYTAFFRNEYVRLLRLVRKMRDSGQAVEDNLEAIRSSKEHPSLNGWDHVFYSAVLNDADLLNYLSAADLPDFL